MKSCETFYFLARPIINIALLYFIHKKIQESLSGVDAEKKKGPKCAVFCRRHREKPSERTLRALLQGSATLLLRTVVHTAVSDRKSTASDPNVLLALCRRLEQKNFPQDPSS